jgi:hypothetical protein
MMIRISFDCLSGETVAFASAKVAAYRRKMQRQIMKDGDYFVLQMLTLAMDMRKDLIANAIVDLFGTVTIIERSEASVAELKEEKSLVRELIT